LKVRCQFLELGMCATDVTELGCPEFGEVGLAFILADGNM